MVRTSRGMRGIIISGVAAGLLLVGCSSTASSESSVVSIAASASSQSPAAATDASAPSVRTVTKYEVVSKLEPLIKAVVSYTDTDYGDESPSQRLIDAVESKYDDIQQQEDLWRDFTSGIDYASSGIAGLETAVMDYNFGLDTWQANQERSIASSKECLSEGGSDVQIAMCTMARYSLSDEQAALSAYITPLKVLLQTLGVATQ